MKIILSACALLATTHALAAPAAPVVVLCPKQDVGQCMPTNFIWDGSAFKQIRQDGRTFVRQVQAAHAAQRVVNGKSAQTWSFQLVPTGDEVQARRRDLVALELVPDAKKKTHALYFKMATLEGDFLTETLLQHSQGCVLGNP